MYGERASGEDHQVDGETNNTKQIKDGEDSLAHSMPAEGDEILSAIESV